MKTVVYCKEGESVNDFRLDQWVKDFIAAEDGSVFKVGTSILFDLIRLYIARGDISYDSTVFEFDGQTIHIDNRGTLERWPVGFCDRWETILEEIIYLGNK